MTAKLTPMAIAYDFDGTLSPKNMQEFNFIPALNMTPSDFWNEKDDLAKEQNADPILAYMVKLLERAKYEGVSIRREDIASFGKAIELFPGVDTWFNRINDYAHTKQINLKHYIISSGLREMIKASKIGSEFEAIYASGFMYDSNDVAHWPALAVNYTTKTQFLFRINKGSPNVWDNTLINTFQPKEKRAVPFENMVFVGDGETDVPCMRLVSDQGGHSIAVYKKHTQGAKAEAQKLVDEGRANFKAVGDYSEGSDIDTQMKGIIDKVATDSNLLKLGKKN